MIKYRKLTKLRGKTGKTGKTTTEEFTDYVNKCKEKGFTVDYYANDNYYNADNADGYSLSISRDSKKKSINVMLDAPSEATSKPQPTATQETVDEKTEDTADDGDTPQWKVFLKEYDEWGDSYVAMAKKAKEHPDDLELLSDLADWAKQTSEWAEKADGVEESLADDKAAQIEYVAELSKIALKLTQVAY